MSDVLFMDEPLYVQFNRICEDANVPVHERVDAFIKYTRKPKHPEVKEYDAFLKNVSSEKRE